MNNHGRPAMSHKFQAFDRMRVPIEARPFALQLHVVRAVRRNRELNAEASFRRALEDLKRGQHSQVLVEVGTLIRQAVAKELEGREVAAATRVLARLGSLDDGDGVCPQIEAFNRDFLNGNGIDALLWMLVIEAADLDLVAIDEYRGGADLQAAYGPRRTRADKRRGVQLQARLKALTSFDETAMTNAADQYVVYRHLDHGRFPDYMRRAELAGLPFSERSLRKWFKDFDKALGHSPPPRGRPPKKGRTHR